MPLISSKAIQARRAVDALKLSAPLGGSYGTESVF
jgi:hypothetical protein